jgi:hypothetical protein
MTENVPPTGPRDIERAPSPSKRVSLALAEPDKRFKGGTVALDGVDLARAEDRDAVLRAVVEAVASGRCGSNVARAIVAAVEAASKDKARQLEADLERAIQIIEDLHGRLGDR